MRLYIIRHGETSWNTQLRLQGQTDIELNENGRALARITARALQDVPFDLAISSPLIRAKETAQIIVGDRKIPIFTDKRIREIGFGLMEGAQMTIEERDHPGTELYNFFHAPDQYRPHGGGEGLGELCSRVEIFLTEIKRRPELQGKTILISTHGAASRAMLAVMKNTSRYRFWEKGVPGNCAVSIVDLQDGNWVVREQDIIYY